MHWWNPRRAFLRLEEELLEIKNTMVTKDELDTIIAGLPAAFKLAADPVIAPILAKLEAIPNVDFTAEATALQGLPGIFAKTLADALTVPAVPVAPSVPVAQPGQVTLPGTITPIP